MEATEITTRLRRSLAALAVAGLIGVASGCGSGGPVTTQTGGTPTVSLGSPTASGPPASNSQRGLVTTFQDPNLSHSAFGIAAGPDGALWFTVPESNSVGRLTTAGAFTDFSDRSVGNAGFITSGPDGALWFTESSGSIGRITTAGVVTSYPSINAFDITTGPDGALWFTDTQTSIGRITTTGAVSRYAAAGAGYITAGPDGALWFTDGSDNSIGRISTSGAVTKFTDANIKGPAFIASGSDGALWFTAGNGIGRISIAGKVTIYTNPSIQSYLAQGLPPHAITAGPDGALWFAYGDGNSSTIYTIGRITTAGVITSYTDPGILDPGTMTAGPDGAVWFTNAISVLATGGTASIGRISA